jgi:hypothetical protein
LHSLVAEGCKGLLVIQHLRGHKEHAFAVRPTNTSHTCAARSSNSCYHVEV